MSSVNNSSIQISFVTQVSLVNTQLSWTSLRRPSELGKHYLLNLANTRMLGGCRKMSSSPEWSWHTLTGKDMIFYVTSKIIYNLINMLMVERHLKFLKGLVRQRACPKDSMVEGYMVYHMMVYVTQYLRNLVAKTHIDCIWDLNSIKKFKGEYLVGNSRFRKVKGNKLWDVIVAS